MFENPRRGRQARNFTTNAPKTLDFKSSSEQIFSAMAMPHWYLGLTIERNIFASLPDLYTQGCDILWLFLLKHLA